MGARAIRRSRQLQRIQSIITAFEKLIGFLYLMKELNAFNYGNEVGYPAFCGACGKRVYIFTVVRDTKYCRDCRIRLDGYDPDKP